MQGPKNGQSSPSGHHLAISRAISLQLRHGSTVGKNLLNSNISSTCPHNMVNFCPLTAAILSGFWGTPANFNGFVCWQHYWAALQYWMSAKRCGVEQRAPPIFGRSAITLGIGPHYSFVVTAHYFFTRDFLTAFSHVFC